MTATVVDLEAVRIAQDERQAHAMNRHPAYSARSAEQPQEPARPVLRLIPGRWLAVVRDPETGGSK